MMIELDKDQLIRFHMNSINIDLKNTTDKHYYCKSVPDNGTANILIDDDILGLKLWI